MTNPAAAGWRAPYSDQYLEQGQAIEDLKIRVNPYSPSKLTYVSARQWGKTRLSIAALKRRVAAQAAEKAGK